jgi:hypothetical protein
VVDPSMTLAARWQPKKCLVVWDEGSRSVSNSSGGRAVSALQSFVEDDLSGCRSMPVEESNLQ